MTSRPRYQDRRLDLTLSVLLWGSLALGIVISALTEGVTPVVSAAALISGAYVIAMQTFPRRLRDTDGVGELLAVLGVVASLISVAITGGITSPYLLFLAGPSLFASVFLGLRIGLETALLTSSGLVVVVATLGQEILQSQVLQVALFYVLLALTSAQARRLLGEAQARGDQLAEATVRTEAKLVRLEAAHSALTSLSELANAAELNPVSVGQAALRDLALTTKYEGGQVVLNDDSGTVVVARRGTLGAPQARIVFPMTLGDRLLGHVDLWTGEAGHDAIDPDLVTEALRPVTLAFDNIMLLRTIARRAVTEERTRLARALHDDLGPTVASLGLGIDVAMQQHSVEPALGRHLTTLREAATALVEQIRRIVADLRHEQTPSLVEQAHLLAADFDADGPAILVDIDEQRPPRTAISGQIAAIMTEAVRNAVEHSNADSIHIRGQVDHESGVLEIVDNGSGFDPDTLVEGHFGLVGIRERARSIDAELAITSPPGGGSSVYLRWGSPEGS